MQSEVWGTKDVISIKQIDPGSHNGVSYQLWLSWPSLIG